MRGKRAPLIAGIGTAAVALLLVLFLVLPKMSEVSEARKELDEAVSQNQTLQSQLAALRDARDRAPEAQRIIDQVEQQIPSVADEPGLLLLLKNAATTSGLTVASFAPATPVFDPTLGLSVISVGVNATGTYFDITEFLFRVQTLPRAAKVTGISLAPSGGGDAPISGVVPTLTLTTTINTYTTDTSAGPGSIPGPTTEAPPGI
jgi:Tfp pilus assembly protein PilO